MLYSTIVAAVVFASSALAGDAPVLGGWSDAPLAAVVPKFYKAASSPTAYLSTPFVCATEFLSASQQVVAGMNYKLHLRGCRVASVAETAKGCRCASPSVLDVTLYQRLDKQLFVTDVADDEPPLIGGFGPVVPATKRDKELYTNATSVQANFQSPTILRVCPQTYVGVAAQLVNGVNHQYTIKGCVVAAPQLDVNKPCTCPKPATYKVNVYESFQHQLQVTAAQEVH